MRDVVKQSVRRRQTPKRTRRRTRTHSRYILLVFALVLALGGALSMTVFFNVTTIRVIDETGNGDEEIVRLSGIRPKENLVRLDERAAAARIERSIAYAENVTVTKEFPSTVVIRVPKAEPAANISYSYGYLLVSEAGRILEKRADAPWENYLIVTGYNPAYDSVGMLLNPDEETRDAVLKTVVSAVKECNNPEIRSFDMTDKSDIIVHFGDTAVFHMGTSSDALYKLKFATRVISQLTPGKRYKIAMVGNNQISVLPDESDEQNEPDEPNQPDNGNAETGANTAQNT